MNNLYKKILKLQLEIGSTPKNGFNTLNLSRKVDNKSNLLLNFIK